MKRALVLAPDADGRTHVVEPDEFLAWVASVTRDEGLAIDTETSSLAWDATVRLVQFGTAERGFAVDASSTTGRDLISRALTRYRGPLIFHNAAFDIHRLDQLGIEPEFVWPRARDTHVMAHIINPDRLSFKLKQLARIELDDESTEAEKALKKVMKKRKWGWHNVPLLVMTPYGVTDTIITRSLYTKFRALLTEDEWDVVMEKEMEVRWAMGLVQWNGMKLDVEYAQALHTDFQNALAEDREWFLQFPLEARKCPRCKGSGTTPSGKKVCSMCNGNGWLRDEHLDNPNADAQIVRALKLMGWEPTVFTEKAGTPKLDKTILKELAPDYELVRRLREYKRKGKWDAAYVVNCLEQVDEAGRVHAAYNTLGAKTGRMSCSNPPLQQLPKGGGGEIRRLFVASPGNVIASCDYSAIEMRLAGALSGEERIIEVYLNNGDIYQQFADELGITRPEAKIFSLATLYGATAKRHAAVFGWDLDRAYDIVYEFWERYPKLGRWNTRVIDMARAGKPIISKWGRTLRPHAAYAAPNAVIQGTAAEVMKDGIMRLWECGLLKWVVAVVHDEVVLDVPQDAAEQIAQQVACVLEDHTFHPPLTAEASVYGTSWGDGYS